VLWDTGEALMRTDVEIERPNMSGEERLARILARAEGHNDENGMFWERHVIAARAVFRQCAVQFRGAK
jgi:hypothetical protein